MYICACDLRHVFTQITQIKAVFLHRTAWGERKRQQPTRQHKHHQRASGEPRPPPPSGCCRYVSETHSQQIKMSWTATTLTGMEGTDIRHIKRMNHPRASCSRRGVADHKHETWCKHCFGRRRSRGSRGWTLCKTPQRRQRWAQREKQLHLWTFSADLPCIDVLMSLCGAWALAANIINSVKATNSRAIVGSPNDWEDKQMHSCSTHKMAALYLKALFSQQLGNNYGVNARNHIACVSQF